jgi:RNA polymerase sigma-70 factor (ECF subfamily)
MSEIRTDAELVASARKGDVEAFGELYRRYFDPIYRYLRARVAQEADAEDLAAAVFLRSYRSLGRYRERGLPFSAFLYQVARNALTDHYRAGRREVSLEHAASVPAPDDDLDDRLDRKSAIARMREAMDRLSEDHREVIRLRLLVGLTTETAAQWMGRSEGAVRVLLFRALEALRREMTESS